MTERIEVGFYHPDLGYWQATAVDPADPEATIDAYDYPEDTEIVPIRPAPNFDWIGGEWVENTDPEPLDVPEKISDRQFFQTLADRELITQEEALAAVKTGELPAAMMAILAAMPEGDRFAAEMLLSGATEFRRDHPLVNAFAAAQTPPWSTQQTDEFWIEAYGK